MKTTSGICALVALAVMASADTITTYADQDQFGDAVTLGSGFVATVQNAGIRGGNSGARFFNVQGRGNVGFESWGAIRFDLTEVYAALPGDAIITGVKLIVEQSNAGFTVPGGPIEVYHVSDDVTNIDPRTNAGALAGLGNILGGNRMYNGSLGGATLAGQFDFTGIPGGPNGVQDMGDISSAEVLADLNNFADSFLTLVLDTDSLAVAATMKGQESPFAGVDAPALEITFIPAPASLALLGMGGLVATRRRR